MSPEVLEPAALESRWHPRATSLSVIAHLLRGVVIGLAELVPGVSGGTIALIMGVYERIIDSANHVVTATRKLISGPDRLHSFRTQFARAEWSLIIPLLIGMGAVVLTMAKVMGRFVSTQPELSNALFLGMVAASVTVPLSLVKRVDVLDTGHRIRAIVLFVFVVIMVFLLTSQRDGTPMENPPMLLVFGAGAVATCALVLPGVSGAFLLLVLGLYTPTMGAIADHDLGYIAVFAIGAVLGLALFVKGLHSLLHHHHALTMISMAGLMLGSLRALWPWQDDAGSVLAPAQDWPVALLLAATGALGVLVLVNINRKMSRTGGAAPTEAVSP